ncbi:hypothetical protein LT493_11895 [Streptomyces tricolor]|nr:hypothetical protein [Streptomyces tricolor]
MIEAPLRVLDEVGLGYLAPGPVRDHVSLRRRGQRVKLANELQRRAGAHLYLLDEPDHRTALQRHRPAVGAAQPGGQGHTVLAVSHNLDLIKTADWVNSTSVPKAATEAARWSPRGPPKPGGRPAGRPHRRFLRDVLGMSERP